MTIADIQMKNRDIAKLGGIVTGLSVLLVSVLTAVFTFITPIVKPKDDGTMILIMRDQTKLMSEITTTQNQLVALQSQTVTEVQNLNAKLSTAIGKQVKVEEFNDRMDNLEKKIAKIYR